MKRLALVLAGLACLAGSARAGSLSPSGDFYLISRDRYGMFVGSHQLFVDYSKGLKQVSYCNRRYFVRSHSVAWTQMEAERGHVIQIEYNIGRGWRPICANPEDQVTLTDIGITGTPQDVLARGDETSGGPGRLSSIGFGENDAGTYHTQ